MTFLGTVIDCASLVYARALPEHTMIGGVIHVGVCMSLRVFQRMLSLMAAASSVIPLGLLHM